MSKPIKLNILPNSLCMTSTDGVEAMALNYCDPALAYLFLVTIVRHIEGERPVTSMFHVIAPDGDEAISQVSSCAFPGGPGPVLTGEQRASLECSAVRIPVYIRGWGHQTF
jgi:hypothetical protein